MADEHSEKERREERKEDGGDKEEGQSTGNKAKDDRTRVGW